MITFPLSTDAPVRGPRQGEWTRADWETLPHGDGNRYEILGGYLYVSTSPSLFHQYILKRCYRLIGLAAEDAGLGQAFFAPVGVFMPGCDPVQPDFVFVGNASADILRERHIYGVPDVIVEIVSPSNTAYDEETKLAAYQQAGVPEYAIIYPAAREVRLFSLNAAGRYDAPRVFDERATLSFTGLPGITVLIGDLFAGAPDTTP
ncbi:MAG: Uma2 family endonuclease [Anaerolineae bacterium]|nr:Uma2 family endonuclease [Anaerolineae bacterium]